MARTLTLDIPMRSSWSAYTLKIQFTGSGGNVGSQVTTGFTGSGSSRGWRGTVPVGADSYRLLNGADDSTLIEFTGLPPAYPGEAMTLDLTQATPNGSTLGEALDAAWAQAYGRWRLDRTAKKLYLYGPDGTSIVRTFDLDSADAPTERTPE